MVVKSILLFLTTVIVIFAGHCITMTLDQNVPKSYSNSACPITLRDKITAANYDEFTTTHLYFQWWPDFEKKEIRAIVTLSMRRLNPAAKTVILDTAHLDIHKIYYPSSRQTLPVLFRLLIFYQLELCIRPLVFIATSPVKIFKGIDDRAV